ncbi:MAG: hypothetical protein BAJALOKI1v1_2560007 [Promethearchaeota archaeon]|nr:MAG: hypothetical protein BAJALOKI1v1_2560007 [Candidatus Lokiarchaeota archaeon]
MPIKELNEKNAVNVVNRLSSNTQLNLRKKHRKKKLLQSLSI